MYDKIIEDNLAETSVFLAFGRAVTAELSAKYAKHVAILDIVTCPICNELDDSTYEVGSSEYYTRMPPIHRGCRCIYVYTNEAEKMGTPVTLDPNSVKKHGQLMGIIESMRNIYIEKSV